MEAAINVGVWSLIGVLVSVLFTAAIMGIRERARRRADTVAYARADANRWTELLGGQLSALDSLGDDEVAKDALGSARESFELSLRQYEAAKSVHQFHCVKATATEGLRYIGVARARLGLVAGPQGPPPVDSEGRPMYEETYRAAPASTKARDGDDRHEKSRGHISPVSGVPNLIQR